MQLKNRIYPKSYSIIFIEMNKQFCRRGSTKESYCNLIATLNLEISTQLTSLMNKNTIYFAKQTQIQRAIPIGFTSKYLTGSHNNK